MILMDWAGGGVKWQNWKTKLKQMFQKFLEQKWKSVRLTLYKNVIAPIKSVKLSRLLSR